MPRTAGHRKGGSDVRTIKGGVAFQTRQDADGMWVRATLADEDGRDLVAWPWVRCEVGNTYMLTGISILLTHAPGEVKAEIGIGPETAEAAVYEETAATTDSGP